MTVRGAEALGTAWLLTVRNVAERLNVSPRTVERLIASGELAHVRPRPHVVRIHPQDLCAYLEARRQEAAPAPSVSPRRPRPRPQNRRIPRESARRFLDELAAVER